MGEETSKEGSNENDVWTSVDTNRRNAKKDFRSELSDQSPETSVESITSEDLFGKKVKKNLNADPAALIKLQLREFAMMELNGFLKQLASDFWFDSCT